MEVRAKVNRQTPANTRQRSWIRREYDKSAKVVSHATSIQLIEIAHIYSDRGLKRQPKNSCDVLHYETHSMNTAMR